MARIKINDLPANKKISKEELRSVKGGISWGSLVLQQGPKEAIAPLAAEGATIALGLDFAPRHQQSPRKSIAPRKTDTTRRKIGRRRRR